MRTPRKSCRTPFSPPSLATTYDESCAVLTWLCGVAKLRIVDFYRRRGAEKRIPPEMVLTLDEHTLRALDDAAAPSLDDVLNRIDATRLTDVIMAALNDEEREMLVLHYFEELSLREIAALRKCTLKAVRHSLAQAKKKAAKAAGKWA